MTRIVIFLLSLLFSLSGPAMGANGDLFLIHRPRDCGPLLQSVEEGRS